MDRFSFLNAAHTEFFADIYEQYTQNPDSVEPSWRAFFQGFDFGMQTYNEENIGEQIGAFATSSASSEKILKEAEEWCISALQKILFNKKQIQQLESLRDTLLPKLMSGEVRVQN